MGCGSVDFGEPTLGVECGLAAAGGGGDPLAVPAVDQVARGEDSIDTRVGSLVAGQDIAAGIEVNQADQLARARSLTDGDKHRRKVNVVLGVGVRAAYTQPGDMALADYGNHFGAVQNNHIGLSAQPGSHGSR